MSAAPAVTLSSSCWSMSVISPPFFLIVRDFEFRDCGEEKRKTLTKRALEGESRGQRIRKGE
jgi:hypothetical protein